MEGINLGKLFITLTFLHTVTSGASLNLSNEGAFRAWFSQIIWEQFRSSPNERWKHRDCAGLVRYAVKESLAIHDEKWKQVNSSPKTFSPPEVILTEKERNELSQWWDGKNRTPFVRAIQLIQNNTNFISKNLITAKVGDLLFYDFGDDQHLMVWMGTYLAYHRGSVSKKDNGLRKLNLRELMHWKDTRWRPLEENPNFVGIYRFSFLP